MAIDDTSLRATPRRTAIGGIGVMAQREASLRAIIATQAGTIRQQNDQLAALRRSLANALVRARRASQ